MRDIYNNGSINVSGDVTVVDNSITNEFDYVSDEKLKEKRDFKEETLRIERNRKIKKWKPNFIMAPVIFTFSCVYGYFAGNDSILAFISALCSVIMLFPALKDLDEPNELERYEKSEIKKLNLLLKSRRAE